MKINSSDIYSDLQSIKNTPHLDKIYIYLQHVVNGRPCKYYFRKFKRLPNFKGANIYPQDGLSQSEINDYCTKDFSSTMNKLAFATNIYGDKIAQLIYNDDIDISGLKDNLGRPLTELYLTLVKNNKGHELWYGNGNQIINNAENIEYSHCFGEITSGLDLPWFSNLHNVHRIHGLDMNSNDATINAFSLLPIDEPLENDITISGDSNNSFLGDIVELDELSLEETVLEQVYHRFNTAQRETMNDEYKTIYDDELTSDDSLSTGFNTETTSFTGEYRANLAPEGYYYQPHHKIQLRKFTEKAEYGYHIQLSFDEYHFVRREGGAHLITARTDKNYFLQRGDKIIVYDKVNNKRGTATITSATGPEYRDVKMTCTIIAQDMLRHNFIFMKINPAMPTNAYELDNDNIGVSAVSRNYQPMECTGLYVWRNIESRANIPNNDELYDMTFTNNAHYIHKNLNFYVRRQDPLAIYGLNYACYFDLPDNFEYLEIEGEEKETSNGEYFEEGGNFIC